MTTNDDASLPCRADPKAEKIMAAAKAAFLDHGYSDTSMDLVAQSARVSKTTLYSRFPSKEALFAATIAVECERRGARFRPEEFEGVAMEEALVVLGRRFVDLVWSPEALRIYRIVVGDAHRFPELARLYYAAGPTKTIDAVAACFRHFQARGDLPPGDPAVTARLFLVMLQGGQWFELSLGIGEAPAETERDAIVRRVVRTFLDGARATG